MRKNVKRIKASKTEPHSISKLSNDSTVLKFVTRKWIEVNDLLSSHYSVNKSIKFKAPISFV